MDEDLGAEEAVRGNASTVEGPTTFEGPTMGTDGAAEPWVATTATDVVGAVPEVPPPQAIGTAVVAAAGGTAGFFCGVRARPMAESQAWYSSRLEQWSSTLLAQAASHFRSKKDSRHAMRQSMYWMTSFWSAENSKTVGGVGARGAGGGLITLSNPAGNGAPTVVTTVVVGSYVEKRYGQLGSWFQHAEKLTYSTGTALLVRP